MTDKAATKEAPVVVAARATIPHHAAATSSCSAADDVAAKLGVAPVDSTSSPRRRKRAYYWFRNFLTLSQILDPISVPNSHVNLQCVWWKAISGNHQNSGPTTTSSSVEIRNDHGGGCYAYDLLPPVTRWAVAPPFAKMYPRFHHANVELRTRYLDLAIDRIIVSLLQNNNGGRDGDDQNRTCTTRKIRLVLMGGGYDLRLIRTAEQYQNNNHHHHHQGGGVPNSSSSSGTNVVCMDLVEVDLPHVIQAKQLLLQKRFLRRRPELREFVNQVRMFAADLNELDNVQQIMDEQILPNNDQSGTTTSCSSSSDDDNNNNDSWYNIFVFEAVMIYLDDKQGTSSRLLSILSQGLRKCGQLGAVCFADTLSNVDDCGNGSSFESARQELERGGWTLQDWLPKPGRTMHLGWAVLKTT